MKIRRFTGTDMRDAMRQVREALGADAVILETSRTCHGRRDLRRHRHRRRSTLSRQATVHDLRGYQGRQTLDADDGPAVRIDQGTCAQRRLVPAAAGARRPPRPANSTRCARRCARSAPCSRPSWAGCSGTRRHGSRRPSATLLRHFTQLGLDPDVARQLATRASGGPPGRRLDRRPAHPGRAAARRRLRRGGRRRRLRGDRPDRRRQDHVNCKTRSAGGPAVRLRSSRPDHDGHLSGRGTGTAGDLTARSWA